MSFTPGQLLRTLDRFEQDAQTASRYVIALSGGLDSTVLAHALSATREQHGKTLLAVHIDHQLQQGSIRFSEHCVDLAGSLDLDLDCIAVDVDLDAGLGPEAAARAARYAALAERLDAGDWLLSAHHRDDQAETLLLNLLRGSGPLGIAGIPALRRFAAGWLARPLLSVSRQALEDYAREQGLSWIDDPSNDDASFDRNFLRGKILPELRARWPDVTARLAKSAALARDAAGLLEGLADHDLEPLTDERGRVDVDGLLRLSRSRQSNALRRAARNAGLPAPGTVHVDGIIDEVLGAREDASPCVRWPGAEARRFRGRLYLLQPLADLRVPEEPWHGEDALELGTGLGRLRLETGAGSGLDPALLTAGLRVSMRRGGEEIRVESQGPTKTVKNLLHERGVAPWLRKRLPLLWAGDRLVAVADLFLAADACVDDGVAVVWEDTPLDR